jgi:hypothetical protein
VIHGRPTPYEDVFPWNTCHEGWRREHAHRVWQAIQAVVAVVASWEQASALWERGSAQDTLEKCESMQRACGWLPK